MKPEKKLKKIDVRKSVHDGFQSEAEIRSFISTNTIHCVSCKQSLTGSEPIDHELVNALAIPLETDAGEIIRSVPRIVCACGYKNTVLKLLYQTHPPISPYLDSD